MELVVPDASVILKWVLRDDEVGRKKALLILTGWLEGKYDIVLPSLWFFEVGNIISRREPNLAFDIMKRLAGYKFVEIKMTEMLLTLILELVREKRVTFYDAIYHAIAIRENGRFITADKDYFAKAKDRGYIQLLDRLV